MGQSQSIIQPEEPVQERAIQPAGAWFLILPIELLIDITKYLAKDDVSHSRLVYKHFDMLLSESFATRHFSRLYILPTTNAVNMLNQIANARLKPYVQDLHFWPSVYQHGMDGRTQETDDGAPRDVVSAHHLNLPTLPSLPTSQYHQTLPNSL